MKQTSLLRGLLARRPLQALLVLSVAFLAIGGIQAEAQSHPVCSSSIIDWDGDGWGWENNKSCTMPTDNNDNTDNVTVLLMMGQSNSLALNTSVSLNGNGVPNGQDSSNSNVIVWTDSGSWETASLCNQVWHRHTSNWRDGYQYSTHPATPDGGCQNSPAFHFAKGIQASQGGTVAIIPSANNGQEIQDWYVDDSSCQLGPKPTRIPSRQGDGLGGGHGSYVRGKVEAALPKLQQAYPNANYQVDVIGWLQGEANNGQPDYDEKLEYLVDGFRCENWYNVNENSSNVRFVAALIAESNNDPAKTGAVLLNNRIRSFANSRSYVRYYDSSGLALLPSGQYYNPHFTGSSVRTIGSGLAGQYNSSPN